MANLLATYLLLAVISRHLAYRRIVSLSNPSPPWRVLSLSHWRQRPLLIRVCTLLAGSGIRPKPHDHYDIEMQDRHALYYALLVFVHFTFP